MNQALVIMSLVNMMVGRNLLFPQVFINFIGLVWVGPIIFAIGFICTYSCYLYVLHLGKHSDFDLAVQYHFWDSKIIRTFYNVFFFLIIFFDLLIVFQFLIIVWAIFLGSQNGLLSTVGNCIALFFYVCLLKYFNISGHILAYGFFIIVIFCIFVFYLIASAPQGNVQIPLYGPFVGIFSGRIGLFLEIQPFIIPLLMNLSTKNISSFIRCTIISFVIGCLILIFLIVGAPYGLYTRQISNPDAPIAIFEFFPYGSWESWIMAILLWLGNVMIFGEVAMIASKRFFSILRTYCTIRERNEQEFFTPAEIGFLAGLHVALASFFILIIYLGSSGKLGVKTYKWQYGILVGVGFILFFLLPAIIQFKCLYFSRLKPVFIFQSSSSKANGGFELRQKLLNNLKFQSISEQERQERSQLTVKKQDSSQMSQNMQESKQISIQSINHEHNYEQNRESSFLRQTIGTNETARIQKIHQACPANIPEGWRRVLDLSSLLLMVGFGAYVMVKNIIEIDENL